MVAMATSNPNLIEELSHTYIQQVGTIDVSLIECLPDFMVVSPAKTGSTWLFSNLCCHPDIFIPDIKEVNYFCNNWRLYDINWYLKYFQKGIGLKKGDVSPTYAILPSYAIEVIRSLMPDLKIIFLMRDPIERAWSHARHNLKYHEANFRFNRATNKSVSDENFIRNFTHDWPFTSGDYLNSLQQWCSFFPKEQFYIGFYENIRKEPQKLLTQIFKFLGVGVVDVDLDHFPIKTVFLEGFKKEHSDNLRGYLRTIYKNRTEELVIFLRDKFALKVPDEWKNTLIGEVITHPISIKTNYKNHDIFLYNGKFYALPNKLRRATTTDENIKDHLDSGNCIVGDSLFEVKFHVNQLYSSQPHPSKNQLVIHPIGKNNTIRISNHEFNDYRLTKILSALPIGYSENYIVFQFVQLFYAIPKSLELHGDITEQTTRDHLNVVSASQLQELVKLIKENVYTEIVP
ncbi:MAG: sulfotransferase domain-containing protein, partial [Candidatus Heimdallarchaeota archaeon]|nr:sulfotransferase domain-containing protein [Candidatus Heimdallarchaeota archaeon]